MNLSIIAQHYAVQLTQLHLRYHFTRGQVPAISLNMQVEVLLSLYRDSEPHHAFPLLYLIIPVALSYNFPQFAFRTLICS